MHMIQVYMISLSRKFVIVAVILLFAPQKKCKQKGNQHVAGRAGSSAASRAVGGWLAVPLYIT